MQNLQPEETYEELYDLITVEQCRDLEERQKEVAKTSVPVEGVPKKRHRQLCKLVAYLQMYTLTGERYADREDKIREWMEADRDRDLKLAEAIPPEHIRCNTCLLSMPVVMRLLHTHQTSGGERPLFMYECPKGCRSRRAVFEDGEE
jgi:hypothetical protein